jgi:hypothetical protein
MIRQIEVFEDLRIPKEKRDPNRYYYELRHADNDWSCPITVEKAVLVNFWGTLISDKPYSLNDGGYYSLSEDEVDEFVRIAGHVF